MQQDYFSKFNQIEKFKQYIESDRNVSKLSFCFYFLHQNKTERK